MKAASLTLAIGHFEYMSFKDYKSYLPIFHKQAVYTCVRKRNINAIFPTHFMLNSLMFYYMFDVEFQGQQYFCHSMRALTVGIHPEH